MSKLNSVQELLRQEIKDPYSEKTQLVKKAPLKMAKTTTSQPEHHDV